MKDSPKDGRNLSAHRFPLKLSTRPPFENASASFHTRWTVKVISLPFSAKKATPFLQFSALPEKVLTKTPGNGWRNFLQKSIFILLEDRNLTGTAWKSARTRFTISFHSHWNLRGISFLRNGLYLGDLKKNRFEPSQPLALALHKEDIEATISLSVSDERITRYLKGETLNIEPEEAAHKKGWHLLCADGYPIGFGKLVNGILKNKYPAGWRV